MGAKPVQTDVWSAMRSVDLAHLSWCIGGIMGSLLLYGILQVMSTRTPPPPPGPPTKCAHDRARGRCASWSAEGGSLQPPAMIRCQCSEPLFELTEGVCVGTWSCSRSQIIASSVSAQQQYPPHL